MTILVDWQIHDYINRGLIGVNPFDATLINPNSIDIRIDDTISWLEDSHHDPVSAIDPYKEPTNLLKMGCRGSSFTIRPNEFVLASTMEYIALPPFIVGELMGKSSLARLGLTIHQTGGFIDAGFSGNITLEVSNVSRYPIILHAGMPIGQLVFYETATAREPYSMRKNSKYQGQVGPTHSRYFMNQKQVIR